MRITFELSDDDLKHFRLIMRKAAAAAATANAKTITSAAAKVLAKVKTSAVPDFINQRLNKLELLIAMVNDDAWALPQEERTRVLSALAYFSDPEDLIPDEIPGLGFLDDAIMVELVVRELKHEIEAYQDFCNFRQGEATRGKAVESLVRDDFLAQRRQQLQSRMRRRRGARRRGANGSKQRGPFSLF